VIDKRRSKSDPIQVLKELVIEEVSLVDRPANPGAEILVFKRLDASVLNSYSVEELTAAMEKVDYQKVGANPEELWQGYIAEVMANHNAELAQRQKHPPDKLTDEEVKELRRKQPWTEEQATAAARKTNIGQSLWQLVQSCVRAREAALLEKLDKMGAEVEANKARAQEIIETYKRIERGRNTVMESIEEITKAAVNGEFSDRLKAWAAVEKVLKNRVSKSTTGADFNQTLLMAMTQKSWNEFYDAYSELPEARVELKKVETRPVGKAMTEINRKAQEMLDKGLVKTFEKGFLRVLESHPELEEQHRRETYG